MPTTLPVRTVARRSFQAWLVLLALSLWAISLAVIFADRGGNGDVYNALSITAP